jgi:GMP synthase (glutamine-hydrolysing)
MDRRVVVLQHVRCETLGLIEKVLADARVTPQYVRTFAGESVPTEMREAAGLIVMGGPMGVYEHARYPHLRDEMRLIQRALHEDKPVLGVCLGSQLLAAALGAEVKPGARKEIGWCPLALSSDAATDPLWSGIESPFMAYHWHGDVFDLPRGAVALASSELTACQAFRYGTHAYGFLFHMEVTDAIIGDMVAAFADELASAGIVGDAIRAGARQHLTALQGIGRRVFGRWAQCL